MSCWIPLLLILFLSTFRCPISFAYVISMSECTSYFIRSCQTFYNPIFTMSQIYVPFLSRSFKYHVPIYLYSYHNVWIFILCLYSYHNVCKPRGFVYSFQSNYNSIPYSANIYPKIYRIVHYIMSSGLFYYVKCLKHYCILSKRGPNVYSIPICALSLKASLV